MLAVQSKEQAERWLKVPSVSSRGCWSAESDQSRWEKESSAFPLLCEQVVQDVGSQCSNTEGVDGSTSPIIQRKLELDKVLVVFFRFNLKILQ